MASLSYPDYARLYLSKEHEQQCPGGARLPTLRWAMGALYRYAGTHYEEWDPKVFKAHLTQWLAAQKLETLKLYREVEHHVEAALVMQSPGVIPAWTGMPRPGQWLAFRNGIVNLTDLMAGGTGTLVGHTPEWFSATVLPYDFDPAAVCPIFTQCLEDWFPGDEGTRALVQEMCGYVLWPGLPIHGGFFLEGRGRNGKSTLIEVMQRMIGKSNYSNLPLEKFQGEYSLTATIDKLANFATETDPGAKLPLATLKQFTAGDEMTTNRKYKDHVSFKPTTKLIVAWNERPIIKDTSDGFWSRIRMIPFTQTFPEGGSHTDTDLPDKLAKELSGILNWSVVGLRRLLDRRRFTVSTVGQAASRGFRDQSDPLRAYFLAHWDIGPGEFPKQTIYNHYLENRLDDMDEPLPQGKFFKELYRCLPGVEAGRQRDKACGARVPVLIGIRPTEQHHDA